jgi:hypothetical protein
VWDPQEDWKVAAVATGTPTVLDLASAAATPRRVEAAGATTFVIGRFRPTAATAEITTFRLPTPRPTS